MQCGETVFLCQFDIFVYSDSGGRDDDDGGGGGGDEEEVCWIHTILAFKVIKKPYHSVETEPNIQAETVQYSFFDPENRNR